MATAESDEAEIEVDCVSIKDKFDLVKKEFYKKHIILAHRKGTQDKVLLVRLKTDALDIQARKDYIRTLIFMCKNHRLAGMVRFEKIVQDGLDVCLVQSFNQFGVLKDLMKQAFEKGKPFKESFVKRWLAYLVTAVYHLHQRRVIHGNLHASNIYMDEASLHVGPVEGFSRILENPGTFTGKGDIWKSNEMDDLERANYMPPEVIGGKIAGPANDIWCIGVLAHFMTTMTFPFQSSRPDNVVSKALKSNPSFYNFGPYEFSDELKAWITRCLDKDPKTRATIKELYGSDYLKETIASLPELQTPSSQTQ